MTSRYIVVPTGRADAATEVIEELTRILSSRGTVATADPLAGIEPDVVVSKPEPALASAASAIRHVEADAVIVPAADLPVPAFDSIGWSLDLAAATNARVILVPDTEGVPAELLSLEVETARSRASDHAATLAAVAVPAPVAGKLSPEGIAVLPLPLTDEALTLLDATAEAVAMTPIGFQTMLLERARTNRKRIVLPEPEDDRVLRAAAQVLARGIADIVFVGDEAATRARAEELGLDISAATIVSPTDPEHLERYAAEFARLRAKKGVTLEQAREKVQDVSYFGTMMVHMGDADGMVSGAIHTTAHTIVPSFQIIKTAPGVSIVSSIFLMLMKDRVWAFGDCAVNPSPTPEQLADIAITSARTAAQFGVNPRVAMLSYSTGTSGSGPAVDAVVEATRLAREKAPELAIEGPIQFDAAVDAAVARVKLPDSPVAGQANVFIFPDLNAGNIGYKAVQRSSGALAVGPVLQGLNKPVNDLSRGALVADIVNTIALTAVQAQG